MSLERNPNSLPNMKMGEGKGLGERMERNCPGATERHSHGRTGAAISHWWNRIFPGEPGEFWRASPQRGAGMQRDESARLRNGQGEDTVRDV